MIKSTILRSQFEKLSAVQPSSSVTDVFNNYSQKFLVLYNDALEQKGLNPDAFIKVKKNGHINEGKVKAYLPEHVLDSEEYKDEIEEMDKMALKALDCPDPEETLKTIKKWCETLALDSNDPSFWEEQTAKYVHYCDFHCGEYIG